MLLKHLSLCSGIGGLDLAAEWAGFKTVGQCEIDSYASKILAKNFKGVHNFGDIRTITSGNVSEYGINRGELTVISAGFPCQPYSLAGKGLGDNDSRDLWDEVARVLNELKPKWFVGENTPGLFARSNQRYFRRVLDDITSLGYTVGWGIWGAGDVGAPHRRDRVFIVAGNADGMHEQTQCKISERKNAEPRGICGKISDSVSERRNKGSIRRGKSEKSRNEKDKRRIQNSGLQSKRICGGISDAIGVRLEEQRQSKHSTAKSGRRNDNFGREKEDDFWERWKVEPDVGRVANGVPNRVDRLRCLGNAVVPQQAYPIFKAIADYERRKSDEQRKRD